MTLSVLIPCYNEKDTILEVLRRVETVALPGWEKEVILVDDGSHDGTRELLRAYTGPARILFQERNKGKAAAVRRAIQESRGDFLVIQDADLEWNPVDIPKLLAAIDRGARCVYGTRHYPGASRPKLSIAYLGVLLLTKLVNLLYGAQLTDVWNGYKLFARDLAKKNEFLGEGFTGELLFTTAVLRSGVEIVEIPVSYAPRTIEEGKKIRYRDGLKALLAILRDRVARGGIHTPPPAVRE